MEAVIFIGIQAAGKTTFYRERFSSTHVHINLDTLKTRSREARLLADCIATGRSFVVDNTNVLPVERARYIPLAKAAGYRVIAYYFPAMLQDALRRNECREGKERIPFKGVAAKYRALQPPRFEEGFDQIYLVRVDHLRRFLIAEWRERAKPMIE